MHDFRVVVGATHTNLIFDLEVPFETTTSEEDLKDEIEREIQKVNPNYFCVITVDHC